jgi:hypothetical protein
LTTMRRAFGLVLIIAVVVAQNDYVFTKRSR